MPATEQTWRDSKLLHVVFGVSSLLMLIATIWMLAADHNREWKQYQRDFREVETWTDQSRIAQQDNAQYEQEVKKREQALLAAQLEVPPESLIADFRSKLVADARRRGVPPPDFTPAQDAYDAMRRATDPDEKIHERERLVRELGRHVTVARFREDNLTTLKKYRAADFDVARSKYEIAVGKNASPQEQDALEADVSDIRKKLDELTLEVQDASTFRKALARDIAQVTAQEVQALKDLEDQRGKLVRLEKALDERQDNFGKELLEMPILDAFGRPLKIEQIWLPRLTINYNFRDVARFDRCTTCHQGIDKTAPGSAIDPGYVREQTVAVDLATPKKPPEDGDAEEGSGQAAKLKQIYGLQWAGRGVLNRDDVTISVVRPESPAAKASLQPGDVIEEIGGVKILDKSLAYRYLVDSVAWGTPLKLSVRRGLPHPYVSHPRLDLFVGSLSPHKMADIGCTICHEGQGSATEFKWASHTPNSPAQGTEWRRKHGWFNNHHWIFPMNPRRFAESSCLKCHHDVVELEPSDRFPDPPAPKLTEGYNVIRQYGCFGCHEINGFDGPNRRVGPDLRVEPNYAAAAQALLEDNSLDDEEREWAHQVVRHPEDSSTRHLLLEAIRSSETDTAAAAPRGDKQPADAPGGEPAKPRVVSANAKKLATILEDVETPGKFRKVGPSLRRVGHKVDFSFLYSWIRKPKDFRPHTRMPQFFGLYDHLEGKGLAESQRYEPIEIRAISEYLLAKTQPYAFADRPQGVNEQPSAERGKKLFETRGCLACHQHSDFPKATMTQGPDLSRIGAKLDREGNPDGGKWLYSWLRDPSSYHSRTLMPNLLLEPLEAEKGKVTDPAADLAAYLLESRKDAGEEQPWQPTNIPPRQLTPEERGAVHDLALESLKDKFPRKQAEKFLQSGIPKERESEVKGDEVELLGDMSQQKQLNYVGRRAISKYGCSGCHDIPGFEDAKPIGTGLADWGRKAPDKLAFEQIAEYMTRFHGGGHGNGDHAEASGADGTAADANGGSANGAGANDAGGESAAGEDAGHALNFQDMDPTTGYFMQALLGHQREGFIWQKLRAPRSYDYKKTENKGYNERLRMPKFNLNDEQIDSAITFVLGLVAEPPALQYVYKAQPRRQAITEGLRIVEKYNCTGCHTLEMDRWKLAYEPKQFSAPAVIKDYPFLEPHMTPQQAKVSLATDTRGLRHATITGMPIVNEQTGKPIRSDEDGAPLEDDDTETPAVYSFALWDNAVLNGQIWPAGVQNLLVPQSAIEKQYAPFGGYLARLIYPSVVAAEKQLNPNAKADEAWGWLPPPLVHEGRKVQTDWLYSFLLDPHMIRPAAVLRMPKFNMSSEEASALVNYFAAADNADYPYDFDPRTRESHLAKEEAAHPGRMKDALKILTDNNFCIKCHLVGDFSPPGSDRAKGPQLDAVYRRLRPGFLRPWVANPKRLLPYTGMPVNIPYDKGVSQELYHGDPTQQLDALVDFLLNYDRYAEGQTSIKSMIKTPPAAATPTENQAAEAETPGTSDPSR